MAITNTNGSNYNIPWQREKTEPGKTYNTYGASNLSEIDSLYFTGDKEKDRTTFDGTFTTYSTDSKPIFT